jgi:hypothetical protein
MESPIPESWINAVLEVLQTGNFAKEILVPRGVARRWDDDSLGAFLCDVREPLIKALSVTGVIGKLIVDQPEPGETYAFWFYYDSRKFYGKICLYNDKITIKLLSAHRPNKGEERL